MAGKLFVESALRELIKKIDPTIRVSEEYLEAFSKRLEVKVGHHIQRAKDNGRSTLRPFDL